MENSKALANLMMALSSDCTAKSVVGLSESPLFHHQCSSICDAIAHLSTDEVSLANVKSTVQALCLPNLNKQKVNHFQTDGVSLFHQHSPASAFRFEPLYDSKISRVT